MLFTDVSSVYVGVFPLEKILAINHSTLEILYAVLQSYWFILLIFQVEKSSKSKPVLNFLRWISMLKLNKVLTA
jgi:hypothetical protein